MWSKSGEEVLQIYLVRGGEKSEGGVGCDEEILHFHILLHIFFPYSFYYLFFHQYVPHPFSAFSQQFFKLLEPCRVGDLSCWMCSLRSLADKEKLVESWEKKVEKGIGHDEDEEG